MRKLVLNYNEMLRTYNRYRRKLVRLQQADKNERRQYILKKHISRLKEKLQMMFSTLKLTTASAGLALGSLFMLPQLADAQSNFLTPQVNPFGITSSGDYQSTPIFADIDGDGDMDMISMSYNYEYDYYSDVYENNFLYYENTGSDENPVFAAPVKNPFGLESIGNSSDRKGSPVFVDLDGDGDMDIVYGDRDGDFYYVENIGTPTAPNFTAPVQNPFDLTRLMVSTGYISFPDGARPTFVDIDGDGDFDLIAGSESGRFYYFENIGDNQNPLFAAPQENPFGLESLNYNRSAPAFIDADADGDFDLLTGSSDGEFYYAENIGTANDPEFSSFQQNPFGLTEVYNGSRSMPTFVDIDNDGDLDLMAGDEYGDFTFFENCPSTSATLNVDAICSYRSSIGIEYRKSGTYEEIIKNVAGCDSIITINLTIVPITDQTVSVANEEVCNASGTTIDLGASDDKVKYYLRDSEDNSVVQGPLIGDGSPISFDTGVLTESKTYNVFAQVATDTTGLVFDGIGSNEKRVDCGNDPSVQISGTEITLEAWLYPTEWRNQTFEGNVINKESGGSLNDFGYMIRVGNNGQISFNIGNGSWNELNSPTGVLSLNTWQHVSATYDGSTMIIYVDGEEVASEPKSISFSSPNSNLTIGNSSNFSNRYFVGTIDEVRVWDVARSQAEIQATMSNCLSGSEIGLAAYYQFEDGAGNEFVSDISPNANTGIIQNMDVNTAWVDGFEMECILCELEMSETASVSVFAPLEGENTSTICNNESIEINGTTYDASNSTGVEVFENIGVNGCDSTVTVNLNVLPALEGTNTSTICFEDSLVINGTTYNLLNPTGTEVFTNAGADGCDSTVTINLDILPAVESFVDDALCITESIVVGETTFDFDNPSGEVVFEGASINGCDSTVYVNLDFSLAPEINTSVSQVINNQGNTVLIASQGNAQYQWLDCDNDFSAISGATNQTFVVQQNGNYAVRITRSGCNEISDCILISTLSTSAYALEEQFSVYPNPTNAVVHVNLPAKYVGRTIELTNTMGQVIESKVISSELVNYDLKNLSNGIYLIKVHTENGFITKKVIKN